MLHKGLGYFGMRRCYGQIHSRKICSRGSGTPAYLLYIRMLFRVRQLRHSSDRQLSDISHLKSPRIPYLVPAPVSQFAYNRCKLYTMLHRRTLPLSTLCYPRTGRPSRLAHLCLPARDVCRDVAYIREQCFSVQS